MGEADHDFLTFDDFAQIHAEQLGLHGGADGVIDRNVVESSLAAPRWVIGYGGDLADGAAAYLYHFAENQGFVDGNKRTAVVAAVAFLGRNGYRLEVFDLEMYDLTMKTATGSSDKIRIADWIRQRLAPVE